MAKNKEIPEYITNELAALGLAIRSHYVDGGNHWSIEYDSPTGRGLARWHWPKMGGNNDPRAFLNNRSQFKRELRRLQCLRKT